MKKGIWLRLGVTMMISEHEMSEIKRADAAGRAIIREKFNNGQCILDGETYIPSGPEGDHVWPVEEEIEFTF
jgi:hypothetical protein